MKEWTLKLRNAPKELPQQVRIAAATKGQTMEQFILGALAAALKSKK